MKKTENLEQKLLEMMAKNKRVTLNEAITSLDVSESTVRRLFVRVEEAGKGVRDYGGIRLAADAVEYSFEAFGERMLDEKRNISLTAVTLLRPGDTVYLDSGTTLACFAEVLRDHIKHNVIDDITVFTNSLVNLNILDEVAKVNLIGGEYRRNRRDFCGYLAEEAIKSLHFTKCFLGADGYSMNVGFTATDFSTARLNELVLKNSNDSYILLDSGKFNIQSVVSYSKNLKVTAAITEAMPEQAVQDTLSNENINIILAGNNINRSFKEDK